MAKNKKKKKHQIGKAEFAFNFISLILLISMVVYFGGRSLYYYSLQNINKRETENTLNGLLLNNNMIIKDGDGLHQDTDGHYFKGVSVNNYLKYGNRLFRIIRINNDGSIRVVTDDLVSIFLWGEDKSYQNSNLRYWLTPINDDAYKEISGVYYDTLPNPKSVLEKTSYTQDRLEKDKVGIGDVTFKDYVTILGINDYVNAGGKNSYLNIKKLFYLNGQNEDAENLYVEDDGSVVGCDTLIGYGVRSVITLKKNLVVNQGNGTLEDPYVIGAEFNNHIDGYVKLGNDIWKVYKEKNGILYLYLNGYIKDENNNEILLSYGKYNSIFDLKDKYNIAYYLNNIYVNNLPYSSILNETRFYTGEFSEDTGYNYKDIFSNVVTCKVGLLNIFDYVSNNELGDYYRINTTSNVGAIQYVSHINGMLEEVDITENKHIVPVISINSNLIKNGVGSLDSPYVVE